MRRRKHKICILLSAVLIALSTACAQEDGNIPIGAISYGVLDKDGAIIDAGKPLVPDPNGELTLRMSVTHNLSDTFDFYILVLQNYMQTDFWVDSSSYSKYGFSIKRNTKRIVPLRLELDDEVREIAVLLMDNPSKASAHPNVLEQPVCILRYPVGAGTLPKTPLTEPYSLMSTSYDVLTLSKDDFLYEPLGRTSTREAFLFLRNDVQDGFLTDDKQDECLNFAVTAFLDGNQVGISDDPVTFISVPPKQTSVQKTVLPDTAGWYRAVAFPHPYGASFPNYETSDGVYSEWVELTSP